MNNQKPVRSPSQSPSPAASAAKAAGSQMSFDQWWTQVSVKLKLKPQLKASLQKHMQVRGFLQKGQFDQGLADFGIKVPAKSPSTVRPVQPAGKPAQAASASKGKS